LTNTDGSKIKIVDPSNYAPSFEPDGMPLYDKYSLSKSSRAAGDIQLCHECMGEKAMKNFKGKMISWNAPIVPSISMAGIELGMDAGEFGFAVNVCG
jgi:hypothetical protein